MSDETVKWGGTRRGVVEVTLEGLAELLQAPKNVTLVAVNHDVQNGRLVIGFTSPDVPEVARGGSPHPTYLLGTNQHHDCGHTTTTMTWETP